MDLVETVSEWLGQPIELRRPIFNGDGAEVWQASSAGRELAVHIHPPWYSSAELEWCHAVAGFAAQRVPAVIVSLQVKGSTFITWENRLVSLSEWVEGADADRNDPAQVGGAGKMLSDLHETLLDWPGPARPVVPRQVRELPELFDPELDSWWAEQEGALVKGVCHGDYYRRNLLVRHGAIVGVLDWHEAHVGPLIGEVAFAAWEFGHDHHMYLVPERFDLFLQGYRQRARHLPDREYECVPRAVRVMLRENIKLALAYGASASDEYQQRLIQAYRRLERWPGRTQL